SRKAAVRMHGLGSPRDSFTGDQRTSLRGFAAPRYSSAPHFLMLARGTDGVIRRMIDKWLKAGVLEEGRLHRPTQGSPQGGVISPCLSNISLPHVLDVWFEHTVRPRLKGRASLVRYADDLVM